MSFFPDRVCVRVRNTTCVQLPWYLFFFFFKASFPEKQPQLYYFLVLWIKKKSRLLFLSLNWGFNLLFLFLTPLKIIPFIYVYVSRCVYIMCVWAPAETWRGHRSLGLEFQVVMSCPNGCWEPNSSLEKQEVLLTSEHLLAPYSNFLRWKFKHLVFNPFLLTTVT